MPSMELPADRTAPSQARRFVAATLREWDVSRSVIDDAVLLVSELVTNALLHARSAPVLECTRRRGRIRFEVCDDSPAVPRRRHYANDAVTGRGLALVETLATRWGTEPLRNGKRVWFEMDLDARSAVR